jgi:RNA polymerase sigma factor (sigma-70 family)
MAGQPEAAGGQEVTPAQGVTAAEVWDAEPVLRRVVAARVRDPAAVDDLVQDALEHLLLARGRLDPEMMVPYGVVTARNLAISYGRQGARNEALRHRLVDVDTPEQPDEALLRDEERTAITVALARLPEVERSAVLAHEVHGTPVADLVEDRVSAGTMRVRLARSRAKLRVEYVLSLRGVELPTTECRSTLFVLAGGDRGRQRSVATGRHLVNCETCASLSEPLVERRRGLAALVPLVALRYVMKTTKSHPLTTSASAAAAAAAVAGGVVLATSGSSPPAAATAVPTASQPARTPSLSLPILSPPLSVAVPVTSTRPPVTSTRPSVTSNTEPTPSVPTGGLVVDGHSLLGTGPSLVAYIGRSVVANAVVVQSVATHNGFWVGPNPRQRVWVELIGPLRPLQLSVGDHVSFVAPLVSQVGTYPVSAGVDPANGAAQLSAQGAHISVLTTDITVTP